MWVLYGLVDVGVGFRDGVRYLGVGVWVIVWYFFVVYVYWVGVYALVYLGVGVVSMVYGIVGNC